MRIAIPLADAAGTLAERFSPSTTFAIFDVHDDTRSVSYLGRQATEAPGCGRTPGFLKGHGVEVVLAHDVSENAVNHLMEAGIVTIQDAPILSADALIAHLVSGTLQAKPPLMAGGGCGGGGCGHCGSHAHAHEEVAVEAQGCGSHGCGGQGACGGQGHQHEHAHGHAAAGAQQGGCGSHCSH